MFKLLASLLRVEPRACLQIKITGFTRPDNAHALHNWIRAWRLPGIFQNPAQKVLVIELEGKRSRLEKLIDELGRHPLLSNSTLVSKYHPYERKYRQFMAF